MLRFCAAFGTRTWRHAASGKTPATGAAALLRRRCRDKACLLCGDNHVHQNPAIANAGFNTFQDLAGSEYGLYDKVNWFRGLLDTFGVVYPQLWDVDFRKQATRLEVPVYFLIGRHDVNAQPKMTEEYFNILTAPHKELIWFERSGHGPWVNKSAKFVDVMVNKVLAKTTAKNVEGKVQE